MDPIKIQPNQNGPHEKKQLKGEGPKVSAKESSRKKTKESENSGFFVFPKAVLEKENFYLQL